MTKRPKRRTATYRGSSYDHIALFYDLVAAPAEARARRVGLELLSPKPNDTVLEVGSGTGHSLVEIVRRVGDGGQVVGLDLSTGMTRLARKRLRRSRGIGGRDVVRPVSLLLGDLRALPIASASFDCAFMSFTLELLTDAEIPTTLAQLRRILSPRGRLGVVALDSTRRAGALGGLYGWFRRHFPELADCRPIDVAGCLEQSDFEVISRRSLSLWSLPVAAVVGAHVRPQTLERPNSTPWVESWTVS